MKHLDPEASFSSLQQQISQLPTFNLVMAKLAIAFFAVLLITVAKFLYRYHAPKVRSFRDAVVCLTIMIFLLFFVIAFLSLSLPALEFILFELQLMKQLKNYQFFCADFVRKVINQYVLFVSFLNFNIVKYMLQVTNVNFILVKQIIYKKHTLLFLCLMYVLQHTAFVKGYIK